MTTFNELDFGTHPGHSDGVQATVFYDNGYGASVIKSSYSYGGDAGLYELAVFKGDKEDHSLNYDTSITSDVLGHLTEDDVTKNLGLIEAL